MWPVFAVEKPFGCGSLGVTNCWLRTFGEQGCEIELNRRPTSNIHARLADSFSTGQVSTCANHGLGRLRYGVLSRHGVSLRVLGIRTMSRESLGQGGGGLLQ